MHLSDAFDTLSVHALPGNWIPYLDVANAIGLFVKKSEGFSIY